MRSTKSTWMANDQIRAEAIHRLNDSVKLTTIRAQFLIMAGMGSGGRCALDHGPRSFSATS